MKHENLKTLTNAQRKRMQRARPRESRKPPKQPGLDPTPEQQSKADYRNAGAAKRRTSVIDTLFKTKRITALERTALNYYADQAAAADRSPVKSNIDFSISSGGGMPIGHETPAQTETKRLERAMGFASRTARAICVDGYSLTQWAINVYGGRQKGKRIVPKRDEHIGRMLEELKAAARRIQL